MNVDTDTYQVTGLPVFLEDTKLLMDEIRRLTFEQAKELWKCNDKLAQLNYDRFRSMDVERCLTPAVLTYEGLQYQHMAPEIFTEGALAYIDRHLRILSGFYGVLKPFDGVTPYRLEMQTKLETENATDLYHFWNNQLYQALYCKFEKDSPKELINLASAEYSKAVLPYLTEDVHCVTCVFGEFVQGKVKVKATLAKMARGEMVRWMAEHQIQTAEDLKQFTGLGFAFEESLSSGTEYVFLKKDICPED